MRKLEEFKAVYKNWRKYFYTGITKGVNTLQRFTLQKEIIEKNQKPEIFNDNIRHGFIMQHMH